MRRGIITRDLITILSKLDRKNRLIIVLEIIKRFVKSQYGLSELFTTRACFFTMFMLFFIVPECNVFIMLASSIASGLCLATFIKM